MFHDSDWPGNIRELENRMARYVILGDEEAFRDEAAPPGADLCRLSSEKMGSIPFKRIAKQAVRQMERELILKVLQANHWNRRKAAQVLSISYRALIYKIREAGLSRRNNRKDFGSPAGARCRRVNRRLSRCESFRSGAFQGSVPSQNQLNLR